MCYCAFKYNNTICVTFCREALLKVFGVRGSPKRVCEFWGFTGLFSKRTLIPNKTNYLINQNLKARKVGGDFIDLLDNTMIFYKNQKHRKSQSCN